MKPFLTNEGNLENPEIMLQDKGGNIASDQSANFQRTLRKYTGKVVL